MSANFAVVGNAGNKRRDWKNMLVFEWSWPGHPSPIVSPHTSLWRFWSPNVSPQLCEASPVVERAKKTGPNLHLLSTLRPGAVKLVLCGHWMHLTSIVISDVREPISLHQAVLYHLHYQLTLTPLRIESARLRICKALPKVQKPRSNISTEEWKALKGLQLDKKIKIIQADKGNATVVLDSTDYDKKVKELLGDKTSYSILKDDPTRTTERKLLNLLRDLKKNKQIPKDVYNDVRPSEGSSKPARFYGILKQHKENKPLWPVVSSCGTATYDLAKVAVQNSSTTGGEFRKDFKGYKRLGRNYGRSGTLLKKKFSWVFYVKSLFTSIPVDEATSVCEERLKGDDAVEKRTKMKVGTIVKLLQLILFEVNRICAWWGPITSNLMGWQWDRQCPQW